MPLSRPFLRSGGALLLAATMFAGPALLCADPAHAFSEIQKLDQPQTQAQAEPAKPTTPPPASQVPLPDPMKPAMPQTEQTPDSDNPDQGEEAAPDDDAAPDDAAPGEDGSAAKPAPDPKGDIARPDIDPNAPLPAVEYDIEKLPEPVRRIRNLLVEACKTGDIEKLRPLIGTGAAQPQLSFGDMTDDPITYLKGLSGDPDGQEILAIMEEVLNAGYVHLDAGTPQDLYVWPYFFGLPLEKLTPPQKVELFKIVTAGDFEEMRTYGSYMFYRLGIKPNGEWAFFIAGE